MRYHPQVTLDDVKALAAMMTWKSRAHAPARSAAARAASSSTRTRSRSQELQRITRRFTHALGENIGPEYDIPAPDVGTNSQTMAWMMDTYSNMVGVGAEADGQGRRHRQAGRERRHARAREGDRAGARLLHPRVGEGEGLQPRRLDDDGAGLRQRRLEHRGHPLEARRLDDRRRRPHRATCTTPRASTRTSSRTTSRPTAASPATRAARRSRARSSSRRRPTSSPRARSRIRSARPRRKALDVKLVVEGANGPCNPAGERILLERGHRHPPRRPRQLRRRHRQLLRVGAEQALGELDRRRGRRAARGGDEARVPRGERLRAHEEVRPARRRVRDRAPAHRGGLQGARDLPVGRAGHGTYARSRDL